MILMSDGKENRKPFIRQVVPDLSSRSVELNSIVISDEADPEYVRVSSDSYFNQNGTGLYRSLRTMMLNEYTSSPGDKLQEVS